MYIHIYLWFRALDLENKGFNITDFICTHTRMHTLRKEKYFVIFHVERRKTFYVIARWAKYSSSLFFLKLARNYDLMMGHFSYSVIK